MGPTSAALPPRGAALLLALTAALLLFRLGQVPLVGPDEPRYTRVAVEMARSGDVVTPTLQGRPWLEKPILYYWMAAAAFRVFGESEAAARLPSVLASVFTVGVTALWGARLYGGAAGLHAGFVLAASVLFFAYGRAASMDALLAACVTAATGLLGLALLGIAGRAAVPAAYVFMGLGTLAKGPLGVLLPLLVAGSYVALARDRQGVRRLLSLPGLAAFLLVAAPWYVLVYRAQGWAFVDTFLLDHNLQRFTSTIHRHPGPFYYYLPLLLAGLFPWSGLIPAALAYARPRVRPADLFVLVWLVLPLVFFSAAGSKLPGYILPCLPPLALLAGRAADELVRGRTAGLPERVGGLIMVTLSTVLGLIPFLARQAGEPAWRLLLPVGAWCFLLGLAFSRRIARDPAGTLRVLRVGGAGLLLLITTAAPTILAGRESGRDLFLPARGREVLAWNAWRTAWMAGYFYNDGKIREVAGLADLTAAAAAGPVLVVCGPGERRQIESLPGYHVRALAMGPRNNVLLRVERLPSGATLHHLHDRPAPGRKAVGDLVHE
jgi:4-amino-4-deoxy-L-arabinose transferase-like glycosyltransferase